MKITRRLPEKKYPYLAVWTGGEPLADWCIDDIMIISMIPQENADNACYVQKLDGAKDGYITKAEHEYKPLPIGTIITLTQ